ncbi:hypothetical protein BDA96_04G104000 [Sorghum bicolor]|uniref:Uncharacterized protein n=2 Tax=Sorghum bicolor TaxID=4558 RepID=A0A921R4P8_SORBI|nr:hypothetical protein BDA96_04G104000 [Sorghum bicolor]KXG29830.1 hypothetical protein SORBI_3004G096000 [Sorghum bicolor]
MSGPTYPSSSLMVAPTRHRRRRRHRSSTSPSTPTLRQLSSASPSPSVTLMLMPSQADAPRRGCVSRRSAWRACSSSSSLRVFFFLPQLYYRTDIYTAYIGQTNRRKF